MARKKAAPAEVPPEPRHRIRLGNDARGIVHVIDYESGDVTRPMSVARLQECAVIDVGRPFTYHVPSAGSGPSGFVFEGMTGENARPWSASQVLAAARFRMFGFSLVVG